MSSLKKLLTDTDCKTLAELSRKLKMSRYFIKSFCAGEFLPTMNTYHTFKESGLDMLAYMPNKAKRSEFISFRLNTDSDDKVEPPPCLILAIEKAGNAQNLARLAGMTMGRMNMILNRKRKISLDMSKRFSEITGIPYIDFAEICNGRNCLGNKSKQDYGLLDGGKPRVSYEYWDSRSAKNEHNGALDAYK